MIARLCPGGQSMSNPWQPVAHAACRGKQHHCQGDSGDRRQY